MLANSPNAEQAKWWDAEEGDHWTDHEERYNAATAAQYVHLRAAAAIAPGESVLDIGCGCGVSTRDAARAAAPGRALGLDLSSRMLERARQRAVEEGVANVTFEQADAQVYPLNAGAFDAVISRFGSMFFSDPVAAFSNIGRALKPGGRVALLVWQAPGENDWVREVRGALEAGRTMPPEGGDGPGPFSLADRAKAESILTQAGFTGVSFQDVREKLSYGDDADHAFRVLSVSGIARGMLRDADDATRVRALDALRATLTAHDTGHGVLFDSATWVITARRP
jgi:SAM-dependent methyltransferase